MDHDNGQARSEDREDAERQCDHCGRASDLLYHFSGWQHEAGEYSMLCDDCHETATLEE